MATCSFLGESNYLGTVPMPAIGMIFSRASTATPSTQYCADYNAVNYGTET